MSIAQSGRVMTRCERETHEEAELTKVEIADDAEEEAEEVIEVFPP